jgi:hypothetical protein
MWAIFSQKYVILAVFFLSPGGKVHLRVKSPGFANFLVATLIWSLPAPGFK